MAVFNDNLALSTRRSLLSLEYAEYNSGTPMSINMDCGSIADCEMDDHQPLMCTEYVHGEHDTDDWDCIDEQAMLDESNYRFSHGVMITE